MYRQHEDESPWDMTRGRGQVADDYAPVAIGAEQGEGSPWYVGRRYVADATLAAKVRRVEETKARETADRHAAYRARQAQGGAA